MELRKNTTRAFLHRKRDGKNHVYHLCRHNRIYVFSSFKNNTFRVYELVVLHLFCRPPVEWYVNDIDRSQSFAGVFGVHSLIHILSVCHTLPVILREELSNS